MKTVLLPLLLAVTPLAGPTVLGVLGVPVFGGTTITGGGGFSGGTVASATTFSDDVTFSGGATAITIAASASEITCSDATCNFNNNVQGPGNFTGNAFVAGSSAFQSGGVADAAGNNIIQLFDDGTTGSIKVTGTKSRGQITLSAGTGTATVNSGALCTCTNATDTDAVGCSVATTTLTATGSGTDVVTYHCL